MLPCTTSSSLPLSPTTTRRGFIRRGSGILTAMGAGVLLPPAWTGFLVASSREDRTAEFLRTAADARYWISADASDIRCGACHQPADAVQGDTFEHPEKYVRCQLCARECILREGERGMCRARINDGGHLKSLVYGRPGAVHLDPIEKKPFFHFLPGSTAFSLGTTGCPLRCKFCQNWELSQARPEDYDIPYTPPERVVEVARQRSAPIIAFTYNEPTVFIEYLTDIARRARSNKKACVLVSCGFMQEEPLREMCDGLLDAVKIDLKGFSPEFYRNVCQAELQPVLRSIKQVSRSGVHLEIVNLVVPSLNDSEKMLTELVKWVVGEVGPDVPVHFTRFHPDYRLLNLSPTPVSTLERAYAIARTQGLHYPFVGNVPGHPGNNTYCPRCGKIVIARSGFFVTKVNLRDGCCEFCGEPIAGVWKSVF
jgi:pyruvate formate lyase activating enzyme